jgi:DNA-binding response OmpR family regulator
MSKHILFVDDDRLAAEALCTALRDRGYAVEYAPTVGTALAQVQKARYDLAILDLMMPTGGLGFVQTKGGFETGIALARRLRTLCKEMKILGITQKETPDATEWFEMHADGLCRKGDALLNPDFLIRRVDRLLSTNRPHLRVFIVHGHDIALRDELKELLENEFAVSVVVLDREAWRGRTLIEKLEEESANIDVAFVLLTPDDFALDQHDRSEYRARPNVLVELGYFFGRLARRSGRVVLLGKEGVAIPSDLHGLGWIDVTHGLPSAREAIVHELAEIMRTRE